MKLLALSVLAFSIILMGEKCPDKKGSVKIEDASTKIEDASKIEDIIKIEDASKKSAPVGPITTKEVVDKIIKVEVKKNKEKQK